MEFTDITVGKNVNLNQKCNLRTGYNLTVQVIMEICKTVSY